MRNPFIINSRAVGQNTLCPTGILSSRAVGQPPKGGMPNYPTAQLTGEGANALGENLHAWQRREGMVARSRSLALPGTIFTSWAGHLAPWIAVAALVGRGVP